MFVKKVCSEKAITNRNDELLPERLHLLADLLRDMGYGRG